MSSLRENLVSEIREELKNHKHCIVFDFGFFLPQNRFEKNEDVFFEILVNGELLPDQKINHRYSNKAYYTITKKAGYKLNKLGYPFFYEKKDKKEQLTLTLRIGKNEYGVRKEETEISFPVILETTNKKPVCGLSLNMNMLNGVIEFTSYYKEGSGWKALYWSNLLDGNDGMFLGEVLKTINTEHSYSYLMPLLPCPQTPDDLMLNCFE